jgi:hypothetical protein
MKPHTINRDELIAHIESERWQRYASSETPDGVKCLEFSNRRQLRVMIGGEVAYFGQSYTDAVNAYNQGEPR